MKKFYGKYKGKVTDNDDKQNLGRIRATVPDVLGQEPCTWALPALPYAAKNVGLFLVPPKDALVWIEFEQGDRQHPIWSGCFWDTSNNDVPKDAGSPDKKILKTNAATITLNDKSGSEGITIETPNSGEKMKIVMDSNGIEISKGSNKIVISSSVSINSGALEVK